MTHLNKPTDPYPDTLMKPIPIAFDVHQGTHSLASFRFASASAVLACGLVACIGTLGPGGSTSTGASGPAPVGTPAPGTEPSTVESKPSPIAARTWRLNKRNYANAVTQLGLNPDPVLSKLPDDTLGAPFVQASSLNVQQVLAEAYADAAEVLGDQAQAQGEAFFKRYASCPWTDSACIDTFIKKLGRTVYRQPVSSVQLTRLKAIFTAGAELSNSAEGMRSVIQAMLQSPAFLYRTEIGSGAVAAGSNIATPLTSHEVASLLAFMVTDAPPDEALSQAADDDALVSPTQIREHFNRLNKTPQALEKTMSFLEALFGVNAIADVTKDAILFPNAVAIQSNLQQSFREDIRFVLSADQPNWASAMRLSTYAVNEPTARVFGISGLTGTGFVRRNVPASERKGLLTHPAVMASFSHASESAPVFRGKMVLSRLLCRPPGSPPANAETMLDADKLPPTATRRQVFDSLIARPACAGCHRTLNSIGFSLDGYDALGAYRTADQKGALDLKGELFAVQDEDTTDAYEGGAQLAELLADSKVAKACVSLQSYRYFLGLPVADTSVDLGTRKDFVAQGAQLTQLAGFIINSPHFLERVK
jgi:Protein of unknown function (DUF1588)/Protein of unknown function (DUF1592)/Protein of unknown function (DUF1595)/Protein of unknown function (DUF1587)